MNLSIDHIGIASDHVERSVDFYVRLLGGTAEQRGDHAVVASGAVRVAIVPRREADPTGYARGHHLALHTSADSRLELLARLSELGAEYEEGRGRLYALDPDGFVIEFLFE